jgi:hypothetical protein
MANPDRKKPIYFVPVQTRPYHFIREADAGETPELIRVFQDLFLQGTGLFSGVMPPDQEGDPFYPWGRIVLGLEDASGNGRPFPFMDPVEPFGFLSSLGSPGIQDLPSWLDPAIRRLNNWPVLVVEGPANDDTIGRTRSSNQPPPELDNTSCSRIQK